MPSQTDISIVAQVAAKCAAQIHSGTGDTTAYAATVDLIHKDLTTRIEVAQLEAQSTLQQAVATTVGAFPGASIVQPQQTPVDVTLQSMGLPTQPSTPPIASTGNDQEDAAWADLLANPGNWYNNIQDGGTSYTGGAKPDFRHKTAVNSKGDKFALWLVSRRYGRTAPEGVFVALGLANPGVAAQPVAQATGAFPQSPAPQDPPF